MRDLDHRDLEHLSDVEEEERQSLVGVKRYAQNIAMLCNLRWLMYRRLQSVVLKLSSCVKGFHIEGIGSIQSLFL